jgi:type II secretory pathway pseudopilin PulG
MLRKRALTLLEIMLVVALLAMVGGVVFWRIDRFIAHKRLEVDASTLKSSLLHARALALYSHADTQVKLRPSKNGWSLEVHRPEDPTVAPLRWPTSIGKCTVFFNEIPVEEITFQLYSSGAVLPQGTITLQTEAQTLKISTQELFKQL